MGKSISSFVRVLGILLGIVAVTSEASEDYSEMSIEELMDVRVQTASKRFEKISRSPATSIVITRQQIIERHYIHLGDILADLPGFAVYGNIGGESAQMVSTRGNAGNNKFIILQNGHRLSPITGEALSVGDNYPVFNASRVEVIYGPASALYGADAMTGVIHIISEDLASVDQKEVSLSYGSDNHKYGFLRAGHSLGGDVRAEFAAHYHLSDNPNLSNAYPLEMGVGPLIDLYSGMPAAASRINGYSNETSSYSIDAKLKFGKSFSVEYNQRSYRQPSATGTLPQYTDFNRFYEPRVRTLAGTYQAELSAGVRTTSSFTYMMSDIATTSGYRNAFSGYSDIWKYSNGQTASFQQDVFWEVSDVHHLAAGIGWANTHTLPQTTDLPREVDPSRPLPGQDMFYPVGTSLPIQFYDVNFSGLGTFAQLQSQWDSSFSSTVGVRYDHDSRFGTSVNPRIGMVYNPSESSAVKLLYAEAFRAPTPNTMYAHFGAFDSVDGVTGKPLASFFHLPNPDLKPEKTRTLELAYMQEVSRSAMVSTSVYASQTNNLITDAVTSGRREFAGGIVDGQIETPVNRGHAHFYGGEVSLNGLHHVDTFDFKPWVSYSMSLGALDDGLGAGATELQYNTAHQIKGGITAIYSVFSITPRFRFQGRSTHTSADPADPSKRLETPSSAVFDLSARWRNVVRGMSLTLDVRNLLDRRYFTPGGPYLSDFRANPQDPRTWQIQMTYEF